MENTILTISPIAQLVCAGILTVVALVVCKISSDFGGLDLTAGSYVGILILHAGAAVASYFMVAQTVAFSVLNLGIAVGAVATAGAMITAGSSRPNEGIKMPATILLSLAAIGCYIAAYCGISIG